MTALLLSYFALPGMALAAEAATPMLSSRDMALEEGKTLYENGQYLAALSKFMTVLRREPRQPEARQYLRLVIDSMRRNPAAVSGKRALSSQMAYPSAALSEEIKQRLHQRSLLLLDLKAIPSVHVMETENGTQVEIETAALFAGKTGGLKEQSIPILDRVAAWLKTYTQEPVIIHCYPEETEDPGTNGSLFLHRYAEIYSFLVEERKLPPSRFISADLITAEKLPAAGEPAPNAEPAAPPAAVNPLAKIPHVVIEAVGVSGARLDAVGPGSAHYALPRWLEFSILSSKALFNPEEGEWASLDLAALTRTGLRSWTFKILSVEKPDRPVFLIEGHGNLLQRISWDGRVKKTGSLVRQGAYVCRLTATDSDGYIMSREITLQVQRTTPEAAPVRVVKRSAKRAKPKQSDEAPLAKESARAGEPADEFLAASETVAAESPVRAIWKQVIQFDANEGDLKPSLGSSLERIAKTLAVYPRQKVRIVGFADGAEKDASALAKKRAETVRDALVNKYEVDKDRVIAAGGQVGSGSNDAGNRKVEMSITN